MIFYFQVFQKMDMHIISYSPILKYPVVQPKNNRTWNNYTNAPRRQSERFWKLYYHDEYDSAPEDSNSYVENEDFKNSDHD